MSRLWEKGLPLDERVLRYTAGEDHLLDARLLAYDVRGSIAHAEMLAEQGLLEQDDSVAISAALRELHTEFAAGEWSIQLEDEDVHTALESRLIDKNRRGRWESSPGALTQRSGVDRDAALFAGCDRSGIR